MSDLAQRITRLATYNSQKAQGLVHTADWAAYMAAEQDWFDSLPHPAGGVRQPVLLSPCPICGFGEWPAGGMHAARLIHLRAHERETQ